MTSGRFHPQDAPAPASVPDALPYRTPTSAAADGSLAHSEPPDTELRLAADGEPDTAAGEPFHALAREFETLASAIEQRPPQLVEALEKRSPHLYWIIPALCALVIGGIATVLLLPGEARTGVAAMPPEVLQTLQDDTCATRVTTLMNGVAAYRARSGSVPPSLAVLYPEFIPFAPVDPVTKQPYGYQIVGDLVSITCPSAQVGSAPPS